MESTDLSSLEKPAHEKPAQVFPVNTHSWRHGHLCGIAAPMPGCGEAWNKEWQLYSTHICYFAHPVVSFKFLGLHYISEIPWVKLDCWEDRKMTERVVSFWTI